MKQTILTVNQTNLLENLIEKYGLFVTSDQIYQQAESTWDYRQAKNLVTRLVNNGWLIRVKRGLYVISDLSSRSFLSLSPLVVANLLLPESYVSFEAALHQYGMFDQLTRRTVSLSLKWRKPVNLAEFEYQFIKTKPQLYFGWQELQVEGRTVRLASPEKALVDMVNFHKSQYSIDLVIEKLREHSQELNFDRLIDDLSKFSVTTIKIFGFIFDLLGFDSSQLFQMIKPVGTNWMFPGDTKFNAKWRLYYREYFDQYQV